MRLLFSLFTGLVLFVALFAIVKIGPEKPVQGSVQSTKLPVTAKAEPPQKMVLKQHKEPPQSVPIPGLSAKPIGKADMVKLDKSERRLELLRGNQVIATYAVALGDAPEGAKRQEGDERTPEGRYTIDWRNPKSSYFLSLHISYPDANDKARAKAAGLSPGGDIMIHGQPNGYDVAGAVLQKFDWTDGCIAVTNNDMKEIWEAVPDGTPIEITP